MIIEYVSCEKNNLITEDNQLASRASSTGIRYEKTGIFHPSYRWVKKQEGMNENETSLIIDGAKDIHHSIAWQQIPWNGYEGAISISAYLNYITYKGKDDRMLTNFLEGSRIYSRNVCTMIYTFRVRAMNTTDMPHTYINIMMQ
jgi:hypothetical protein